MSNLQTSISIFLVLIGLSIFFFYFEENCFQANSFDTRFNETEIFVNGSAVNQGFSLISFLNPLNSECSGNPFWYKIIVYGLWIMFGIYLYVMIVRGNA